VIVGDTPVFLFRDGDEVYAIHDRCSHRGCSLADGTVEGRTVECPCHGSRFDLADGSLKRGPATAAQPAYETREQDGRVEIRLRAT
jgi:nitrite reductase/ring-hydroxylating ferredoxin subunit